MGQEGASNDSGIYLRSKLNELRQQEIGDDLPIDVPKWYRSKTVDDLAAKSKCTKDKSWVC